MGLVDDDGAQVGEEVSPAVVIRQDADVQHVRVGEDHVRGSTDLATVLERRVPVVDRRAQPGKREGDQGAELILRECLRRIEVERASLWISCDGVEDRQVEGQGLPGRRAGCDADVLTARHCIPRRALVGVEVVDADRRAGGRREGVRHLCERRAAPGFRSEVGELLTLEELAEGL